MKQFLQVFKFEFAGLTKGKWFKVSTVVICAMVVVVMFLPRVIDMGGNDTANDVSSTEKTIGIFDPQHVFEDDTTLKTAFPKATFVAQDSIESLRNAIHDNSVDQGFYIENAMKYQYLVLDSTLTDSNSYILESVMNTQYRINTMKELGLNDQQVTQILTGQIQGDTEILGTDGKQNYYYTYVLIFMLYFVIIFYGQMTATNVASEKGNRSMEILVTSTSSNSLIFGKVLAGAIAGILQIAVLLGVSMLAYRFNADVWNNSLDFLFNIPASVLLTFAVFGTLGYLFYSFIYGAIGAMVSKVEEVSSAVSPITIVFILAFFMTLFFVMVDPDTLMGTIAIYLPFSSCMAMFARIAMGSVAWWEIILSVIILAGSTIAMGLIGAKLYRHGTLSYGNSFKFSQIFQLVKKKDEH